MRKDLPKGFTCECGEFHRFSLYVFAHWGIILHHTCEKCGAEHSILQGHATLVEKKGRKPRKGGA